MGIVVYQCGCSITIDMFQHKICNVNLCFWHSYLYDEDKTPKQLVKDLEESIHGSSVTNCFHNCHYYYRANRKSGVNQESYRCEGCNHEMLDGIYAENNNGWIPNVNGN